MGKLDHGQTITRQIESESGVYISGNTRYQYNALDSL